MQEFPEWTGDCAPCDFSLPVPDILSPIIFGLNRIACLGIHCTADIELMTTCGGRKVMAIYVIFPFSTSVKVIVINPPGGGMPGQDIPWLP